MISQYQVWEARKGRPVKIRCEAALGLQRVKIEGVWCDRNTAGIFDTEEQCQEWIDKTREELKNKTLADIDPAFLPVLR